DGAPAQCPHCGSAGDQERRHGRLHCLPSRQPQPNQPGDRPRFALGNLDLLGHCVHLLEHFNGLTPVRAQTAAVLNPTAAAPTASDAHRPRTSGMRKNGRAIVGLIIAIPSIAPLNPSFPAWSSSSAATRNARMTIASCPVSSTVK